jgi:DNA-binding beta-propeller fold protein YncE
MMQKCLSLVLSLLTLTGAALLAPSADPPASPPKYQVVEGWPSLPVGTKLGQVTAVAIDPADRVYLFHRGKQPILVLDKDGKLLRGWGDGVVNTAHGLRIDANNHVWITDIGNHLVTKLDAEGKVLLTLGKKGQPGDGPDQFNKPTDVAVAPSGEIYVADGYGNARVVKFSKDGKYQKEWGKKGTAAGEFNLPHAVCLDPQGRVYVGDRENNRVQIFDASTGRMLVADGRANQVRVLDRDGKELGRWGAKGTAAGEFGMPHWVSMDTHGAVYVAEVNGQRVQKFVAK